MERLRLPILNRKNRITLKYLLIGAWFAYAFLCTLSIALFIGSIPIHFYDGISSNGIFRTIMSLTSAAQGFIVFLLFHLIFKTYSKWVESDEVDLAKLRWICRTLYCTAIIDLAFMIQKHSFPIIKKSPEQIAQDSPTLLPFIENKGITLDIINYALPRPIGIGAIIIALFISLWLSEQRNPNQDRNLDGSTTT